MLQAPGFFPASPWRQPQNSSTLYVLGLQPAGAEPQVGGLWCECFQDKFKVPPSRAGLNQDWMTQCPWPSAPFRLLLDPQASIAVMRSPCLLWGHLSVSFLILFSSHLAFPSPTLSPPSVLGVM